LRRTAVDEPFEEATVSTHAFRWIRRIAVGLVVLLAAGYGVGLLATRHTPTSKLTFGVPNALTDSGQATTTETQAAPVPEAQNADASSGSAQTLPATPQRIVKTADLTVRVKSGRFDQAWALIASITSNLGGYIASSGRNTQPTPGPVPVPEAAASSSNQPASGDITIRVPAAGFERALVQLRAIGDVTADRVSSQDVTQDYVDLQGRLRNQRAQQAALLRLMGQAKTVSDTLAVQAQLASVEDQIEQITGRLGLLADQTSLATITVHLFEPNAPGAPPATTRPSFSKAWSTALDGLTRIGTVAMIALIWLAPFAALAAAGVWLRRTRARPAAPQA
jgi:hypothetical protein